MDIEHIKEYRKLGLNIAYYRKERGLTQAKLAELIGVEMGHIQKIETAHAGISLDKLFKISKIFNIDAYKLLVFRD